MAGSNIAALGQVQVGALAAGNLALVVPALLGGKPSGYQPLSPQLPNGGVQPLQPAFVFQIEGENKVSLESDITDHYIENNSPIQDGITLHPKIISVHGFVGELSDVPSGFSNTLNSAQGVAKTVVNKLQGVSAYAPGLSTTATRVYNQAAQTYATANSVYNSGSSVLDSLTGVSPSQGKQAQAFIQFENWRDNRQLFNVQTPWRIYKNVAILSLIATQDEKTNMITDFLITFKQMNFTSVTVLPGIATAGPLAIPPLGVPLYNASSSQLSALAPTSGESVTSQSQLSGSTASGVFSL